MIDKQFLINYYGSLLEHCTPLSNREVAPHEYGSFENIIAGKLHRKERKIEIPKNDVAELFFLFVTQLDSITWDMINAPHSLLPPRAIPHGGEALLGDDFAAISNAIMRWYGSQEVFSVLRDRYFYDSASHQLIMQ